MSNTRIQIFSFISCKTTADQMSEIVNEFLQDPNINVDPADVEFLPDDVTTISVCYTLRKSRNKNIKERSKTSNAN